MEQITHQIEHIYIYIYTPEAIEAVNEGPAARSSTNQLDKNRAQIGMVQIYIYHPESQSMFGCKTTNLNVCANAANEKGQNINPHTKTIKYNFPKTPE